MKKKLIAWFLAMSMALSPINIWGMEEIPVFLDAPEIETASDNMIENDTEGLGHTAESGGEFQEGITESDAEIPAFSDGGETTTILNENAAAAANGFNDPVILTLGKESVVETLNGESVFFEFTPEKEGTYHFVQKWDTGESADFAHKGNPGVPIRIFSIKGSPEAKQLTLFVEKVPDIKSIQPISMPKELTGYLQTGGENLYSFMGFLNPDIKVTFADEPEQVVKYREGLKRYGQFQIRPSQDINGNFGILSKGEHKFVLEIAGYTSDIFTYQLKDINSADRQWPRITETTENNVVLMKNYASCYAFELTAGTCDTSYQIAYPEGIPELSTRIYNQSGNREIYHDKKIQYTVPKNEIRYVIAVPLSDMKYPDEFSVSAESEIIPEYTQEGTYEISLTNGSAQYYFTAPESKTYRFSSTSTEIFQDLAGTETGGKSFAYEMRKGERYRINVNATSDFSASSAKITIEEAPSLLSMEVTDSVKRQCILSDSWLLNEYNKLNIPIRLNFDDGSFWEKTYDSNYIRLEDYGNIYLRLLDEQGNEVSLTDIKEKTYHSQFYIKENEKIYAQGPDIEYISINNLSLSELNIDTESKIRKSSVGDGSFLAKMPVRETDETYMLDYNMNGVNLFDQICKVNPETGILEIVRFPEEKITVPANEAYYLWIHCADYACPDEIRCLLKIKNMVDLLSITCVSKIDKEEYIREFWSPYSIVEKYDFEIKTSDGKTEILNCIWNSYSKSLDVRLDVQKSDKESGEFWVGFDEFPDQMVTIKSNLVSLSDVEEGKCKTKITDITEYLGATEYQDVWTNLNTNKGYFKFTAPKTGNYKFSQKYSSRTMIYNKTDSNYQSYEGSYILTMEKGQTIYGCGGVSGNTMQMKVAETTDSQKPEVASIELKKGALSCDQFLSGILYYNSPASMNDAFSGEVLTVTYKNGEQEEIIVDAFEPENRSRYYQTDVSITWPESVYGEASVEFVLSDHGTTVGKSSPYTFRILNEETENIPVISTEGRHEITDNLGSFGPRQVFAFKAPESGKYSFVIDKNVNNWMGFDDVCIYPRNYRSLPPGEESGYLDYFTDAQKGWTYNLKAGEEICIGISMEMKPQWIDIQKHDGVEMSVEGLSSTVIEEYQYEAYENVTVHLNYKDGTQEIFRYEDEKSSYLGNAQCDTYSTETEITYYMENDRTVSASYPVKRISVKDAFESGQIPGITESETEYTIPAKYNHLNIYAITMEEAGFYQITVKHNGKDITKNIRHMVHRESDKPGVYYTYDSQYPISFKAGETVYVANEYLDDGISVSVKKVTGIRSLELDTSNGSPVISKRYVAELLEQLDSEIEKIYFGDCWFNVTFDDGTTERVKFGNKVSGYGEIGISWPWEEYDLDIIQTGDNLTANFYIEGADSVYDPLEGLTIKAAAHLGITSSEKDDKILFSQALEAGRASCFQYKAEEDAIYTIAFSEEMPAAKAMAEAENNETITEQVKIVVSDENNEKGEIVYDFPVVPNGEISVPLKQKQTMLVSYYGNCDAAEITEDTTEDMELQVIPGNVRFLAGDGAYNFDGWTFKLDEKIYTADDVTKYGKILPKWDFSGDLTQTPGTYKVTFYLEMRSEIKSEPVEVMVVSAGEYGLPSINENTAYSFQNSKAIFTVAKDALYEYSIQWKEGAKHTLSYMNSMGETKYLDKETDTLYLNQGLYVFSDYENTVVSIKIKKIDHAKLKELHTEAAEIKREEYNCTDEEWTSFISAMENAAVILSGRHTQSEIDTAFDTLKNAIAKLEKKPIVTPDPTPTPRPPVIVYPTPKPLPDYVPDDSRWDGDTIITPNGTQVKTDGSIILPDGTELVPDSEGKKPSIDKSGIVTDINGIAIHPDYSIMLPGRDSEDKADDTIVSKENGAENPSYNPKDETVTIKEGNTVTHPNEMVQKPETGSVVNREGTILMPDGTKITSDGVTHRTDGGQTSYKGDVLKPAIPVCANTNAEGNMPTVVLEDQVYGAEGYDYVIGTDIACIKTKDYLQIRKNQLAVKAQFSYLPKGTYYAYCHSWIRDKNGKKIFSTWSKPYEFKITSTTPAKPQILKVKVKGRNITVTYKKSKNASGYDLVLGTRVKKINGEYRPVAYGKYVIKNVGKNVESITFKNVKPGTYYVGMHAFNRTSKNKTKVFSPWSNRKTVKIK